MKETIDPAVGLRRSMRGSWRLAWACRTAGGPGSEVHAGSIHAYEQMDASLAEINPFLLTKDNRVIALDAKINFDDNALFRHKEFLDLRDLAEEEPLKSKVEV